MPARRSAPLGWPIVAERRPGWFTRWREARAARAYRRVMARELALRQLEEEGRWAELAVALGEIARDYAKLTRVSGHTRAALRARIRRCDALVRAGQVDQAKLEITVLANLVVEYEGPDGELARELRETVAAFGDTGETGG
jgi:hypothetical protein